MFAVLSANAQAPVANFSAAPTNSCAPVVVQFTDLSTNSPTSWSWNLGNGTTSILQNPSTTYNTPGTYTITLTVSNASGSNTKTITNYITILPAPTVAFAATDTSVGCGSKAVQFSNTSNLGSTGTGTYYWDFGDGTNSSSANPSHTYTSPGSYSVSLIVTNAAGCTKLLTKTQYINVVTPAAANFTATNNNSCNAPVTTSFTNTSTGATSYQWSFGDGGTSTASSPTHTYTSSGSYTVRLIATGAGGCTDTAIKTSFVNIGSLAASFTKSASSACTNNNISFTNTTTPGAGGSTWYFGDGSTSTLTNPTHAYAAAGTYTVKLVVTYNNCADSATSTVTITSGPTTSFLGNPITACAAPLTTTFTNNTSGAVSYLWLFGDGTTSTSTNPSHTYSANGNYDVTLISTSSNGCTDTLKKVSYVAIQPISAAFNANPLTGCAPITTSFSSAVISLVPITSYYWNFGDGTTASGSFTSHTYSNPGTYIVTFAANAGSSCTDTFRATVFVTSKPTAAFSASPTTSCANSPVTFTSSSTGGTSYIWLFGDGTTGSGSSTSHNYDQPGTYTVTLVVSNGGCNDTLVKTNYITILNPSADFTFSFPCSNRLAYTFTNTSTGATSYQWNFGDGGTSTATNPSHAYTTTGTYTVTLTSVNSTTGCSTAVSKPVIIQNLTSDFSVSDTVICKGSAVTFTFLSPVMSGTVSYDFGDGSPVVTAGNLFSTTHAYTTSGVYTVKVKFVDLNGCADSTTKTNYIRVNSPTAAFSSTPSGGCGPMTVVFTDLSTASSGKSITNRLWDFNDGTTLVTSATTVSHTFISAGTYTVKLVITETGGCVDSVVKTNLITVNRPYVNFLALNSLACVNQPVAFSNYCSGSTTLSYNWNFGDGGSSTGFIPTHIYTTSGTYSVTLVATDANGCKDSLTRSSYINVGSVTAAFTMNDSVGQCPPFTVNFTNTSANAVSYQWLFGNGSSSSLTSPSATFTTAGTFQVMLIATHANGCKDTAIHTVTVAPSPTGTLSYTPLNGCSPLSVTLSTTSSNTTSITYDFDNGSTITTTASSVTYTYTQPGIFIPKVIFNKVAGCSTFLQGADTIRNSKAYAGFSASPQTACVNTSIQFTDTSHAVPAGTTTIVWNFGDGGTSTATNPTHTYTTAGTYSVRQIVTTGNGCADTAFRTVAINPLPVLTVSNQTICSGSTAQLNASGAATYSWTPSTGLSCTSCANPTANPGTTTTYTLTGTSALGCSTSSPVTVTVNPNPTVSVSSAASICAGTSTSLSATGASTYSWTPSTGLSCTACASPTASPAATTTYKVVGANTYGCQDSATVTVTVNAAPVITTGGNQFICPGGSATLNASGAASYVWSPAAGLSCTACASPVASPSTTTTYKVVGTSAAGCKDSTTLTVTVNSVPTISVSGTLAVCAGASTTLTASGATSYSWTPSTGLSCTTCASPTVTPGSTTVYTVSGTSGVGCSASTNVTVTVNPLPTVNAGADAAICAGASATLSASGAASYSWSPVSGLSCTSCAGPVASPTTTTSYIVTGTTASGCTGTDTVVVTVNPLPVVSGGANQAICASGSVTLNASGAASYVWSPAGGLSCTTCASPSASPAATTTYKVIGTSSLGCKDSANVTVTVNPIPTVSVTGTNTICVGGNTTLTASGATSYSWTPSTGLSCTTCASPVAAPTTTTTYTVTGASGVGCTATTTYTVTVNPLPNVNAGIDTAFCAGSSVTLNATGAASYSWSPATGLSCTNCASPVASPANTTTYVVTGTSASGCVNTDTIVVTVKPLPVISAGTNVFICPGGSVVLNATGGASYVWSPSNGLSCTACASPTASPTSNTVYTVAGTGANGCTVNASVTVTINPNPSVTVTGNSAICAGANTTLTATGANTYSWSPATGLSCTNCASPAANPASTTTYTVTGTSGVGCTATTTYTLTVNPLPAVSGGPDKTICAGGSATLNATGATTYSWSPATGLSCTACANPTANPSSTTTYTVTGTNSNGCVNTANVTVTVNPLPVVSAGSNVSICPGGNATLTASGASSYVWSPASGLSCTTCASPTASPAATTTYTVTATSASGCVNTSSVTVSINPTPNVTVSGNSAICAGGSTTLTASGAVSYSWSPATGLSCTSCANPTANPTITTTYTVTGTSGVGCTGTATYTLTVNPLPSVNAGADVAVCVGTPTTLSATGAASYSWSPAAGLSCTNCASPTANPGATTSYVVTGTSAAGCVKTDTVVVIVNPLPIVSAGNNTGICPGGTTTLAPSGALSYVWNSSSSLSCTACTSPVATPTATTTYTVTGTAANGCSAIASVTVTVNPLPSVTVSGKTDVCAGSSSTLTASGASSYSWSPATDLSCTNCASPVANLTATRTYTIVGTSGTGCIDSAHITLTLRPLPVVTVDTPQTVCRNTPVTLTAGGATTYSWSPASGLSCSSCTSPTATPQTTTTYIVTGTDTYGCLASAQTTITIIDLPQVDAGPDVSICKFTSTTLSASGAASYMWSPATGLSCTTCTNPVASPTSTTAYVLTGTGTTGCVNTDTVVVNIYAQPPVNAGPDQTICAGKEAQLQASGALNYVWNPAGTLNCATCANPMANPMQNTTYTVTGTDVHGCVDSDQVNITVIQHNPVSVDPGGEVCAGGAVQLNAYGGDAYTWFPANGLSCATCSSTTANPAQTTTYFVSIRQGYCFADTLSAQVIVHPIPTIDAGPDKDIILGSPVQINTVATNTQTYAWTPSEGLSCNNCANPTASPARDMTYVVTVTSDFGCTASDEVIVRVHCDGSQVWLPNTFTPNADGQNDRFYPHGKGIETVAQFRVYDRWGELIFERQNMPVNDKSYGWDGTYKSQPLKPDVYVWIMDATCTNGEHMQTKGDITLIR
jgi:gliding motility-associated-like protein